MFQLRKGFYRSPEADGTGGSGGDKSAQGNGQADGTTNETFDAFMAKQPENVRKLYDGHITGLKNTVDATRKERDDFSKQIKDLLPKVEKGSEAEKTILDLQAKQLVSDKRANFMDEAIKPEIGCSNLKAAWALAVADDLFDKRGNPDWAALKLAAPELFRGKKSPDGDGGNGSRGNNNTTVSMDDRIRLAAGVNKVN